MALVWLNRVTNTAQRRVLITNHRELRRSLCHEPDLSSDLFYRQHAQRSFTTIPLQILTTPIMMAQGVSKARRSQTKLSRNLQQQLLDVLARTGTVKDFEMLGMIY